MILSGGVPTNTPTQLAILSDTTPMWANAQYYARTSLSLSGLQSAYGALYRQQLWVGVVVRKLAMLTARIPLDLKTQFSVNEQRPQPGALADLLARPNPTLSGFKLWLWTSATKSVYGEAFWLKIRGAGRQVRELHPLHPANTVVRRRDDGSLEYVYMSGGTYSTSLPAYPASEIVAFTNYNPDTLNRGMSNLESLRATLLNEDASRRAQSSFWQKGARPSVVLTHPQTVSEKAAARITAGWEASQRGADNMGGTVLLEEGVVPHVLQLSSEDMQYIEGRKLNREEVAAAFDIPPPAIHILDHATFSNITEQLRSVYRDTMAPEFEQYESVLDHQLVPDFYPPTGPKVFTRFNMDEVLRGDFEVRAAAVLGLVDHGILTPNEGRPMFGQAPYPDKVADKLFANAAMVPLGSPAERVSITATGSATPAQQGEVAEVVGSADATASNSPIKRFTVRAIRGRIGFKATTPAEQRKALIAEHTAAVKAFFDRQRPGGRKAFTPGDWDTELAGLLVTLGQATGETIGGQVAKALGGGYTLDELSSWLAGEAAGSAGAINQTTANQIQAAIDQAETDGEDPDTAVADLFGGTLPSRADQIGITRVAIVAGYATVDAGRQNQATTKTWIVTSNRPRASHSAMAGETAALDESFSNGMNWPGDPAGGPDEVAGCTCTVDVTTE